MSLALALVHYPVYNKKGRVVATSLTNLDIHDIARAARTYGARPYFIVHAIPEMQDFAREVIAHWSKGFGADYNATRKEALDGIEIVPDLAEVDRSLRKQWGKPPRFVATTARRFPFTTSYAQLRALIEREEEDFCLILGTGYGLENEIMAEADYILEPIIGATDYNHLSVRSAAAIILDRLLSPDRSSGGGQI